MKETGAKQNLIIKVTIASNMYMFIEFTSLTLGPACPGGPGSPPSPSRPDGPRCPLNPFLPGGPGGPCTQTKTLD